MIAATLQDHADAALRESIRWRVVVDRHDMLLALNNVAYDGKLVYACGLFDTQAKLQAPLGMMCEPALDAAWMQLRDRHAAVRQELEETLRQNVCRGVRATQDSRLIERLQNASRELRTLSVAQAASSPPASWQPSSTTEVTRCSYCGRSVAQAELIRGAKCNAARLLPYPLAFRAFRRLRQMSFSNRHLEGETYG